MSATVFGAAGFVGRELGAHLRGHGYDVREIVRGDESWRGADLGHAFYCIGLTADFRSRPFETMDAHVSLLADVLRGARFRSFVYLSSTRVYARAASTDEAAAIPVQPAAADDLYNISKLAGEAACLGSGLANVRVARLSNVFGRGMGASTFLAAVLQEAADTGAVRLETGLASEKDYVWIGDVVAALEAIAVRGSDAITNVAYGTNTTHAAIVEALREVTAARVTVAPGAPTVRFPEIDTRRLDGLGGAKRTALAPMIGALASALKGHSLVEVG